MASLPPTSSISAAPLQQQAGTAPVHETPFVTQVLPPLANVTNITNGLNSASSRLAAESEKHPKGKRKRTAAKDKMILEEAYSSNPKPDKQARLEIVQRVSLNEKEVQIWFQNRRQNDRRKSRPLSAQEIAALRYGGMHVISDPLLPNTPAKLEPPCPSDPNGPRVTDSTSSPRTLDYTPSLPRSHSDIITTTPIPTSRDPVPLHPEVTPKHDEYPSMTDSQEGHSSLSSSMNSSVGYLANRWNLGSSFSTPSTISRGGDDSFKFELPPPSSCTSEPSQPLSHSQSHSQSTFRLSLSLEGKAELVSNQNSPTRNIPPRPSSTTPSLPQVRQRTLQRSQSALPSITLPPLSALTNSLPPRLMRGRSRDVHAWESCADAESRDELTAQAENESNGSAIAAISLLRSSSGVLQPSGAKRNAPVSKSQRPPQAKRAKLGRTMSSMAQLENSVAEGDKPEKDFSGKVKVSMLVSPSGDSDKENWSPDEDGNASEFNRRRPLPPAALKAQNPRRLGRVLQDHRGANLLANRANTAPMKRSLAKEGVEIFEDSPKRGPASREDEVERFMRGGEVSPSKKPDLDCVAGLLSLSQGAWR